MKTALKTAPTKYPVSLEEAKAHLNITLGWTEDDDYIKSLLYVATKKAEQFLRRRLITQTWYAYYDAWPDENYFVLPFGQLQSVTSVKYTETDTTQNTWSATEYNADTDADPGRVILEYDYVWPTETLHPQNPIVIEFVCGYGDTGADVEVNIKHAIKIIIDDLYNNRGDNLIGVSGQNLNASKCLLMPYRLHNVATE